MVTCEVLLECAKEIVELDAELEVLTAKKEAMDEHGGYPDEVRELG